MTHQTYYAGAMPLSPPTNALAQNYQQLQQALQHALVQAGRAADSCQLLAVSKTQPIAAITALKACGHRHFAENRVQEAQEKFSTAELTSPHLQLHLIGPLQTNKAKAAVQLFDVIHTIDRPALVQALAKLRAAGVVNRHGKFPQLLVQVNIGAEPQKAGVAVAELPSLLASARAAGLPLVGLMCIPPHQQPALPYFQQLAALAQTHQLPHLSMGMSADWQEAVAAGATFVRLGTALFGGR